MALEITAVVVGFVLIAYAVIATGVALHYREQWQKAEDELGAEQVRADELRQTTAEMKGLAGVLDGQVASMREQMALMTARLLDTALPARKEGGGDDEDRVRSSAEYEPPEQQVGDWTDPFFAVDRPLVAGLSPGQGIPGIGTEDGPKMDYQSPLVQEVDSPYSDHDPLSHDEQVQAIGEELFDAWEDSR